MSDHGDHGHGGHDDGHGHGAPAAPEVPAEPRPVLDGVDLQIESQWLNADLGHERPLIVFLHEGLGSLSQWRDFPQRLCDAAQCRGLEFSRPGYGRSTPRTEPWPQD